MNVESAEDRWIGDYFIDAKLGQGAMGVVYRVRHRNGQGPFALKLLKAETLEDSRALKRFSAEVGSQKLLGEYPGIVGVVDHGFSARGPFYVMPMVEGTTLRDLQEQRERPLGEAAGLEHVGTVVQALAYAHDRGFVHRDVKPENVMVTPEGEAFLTDFGIVHVLGGLDRLTRTGELLGTPMYMAPEQISLDFGKPSPATDVYAIGVMIYQILCKRSPYEATTTIALMSAVLAGDAYPTPQSLRPRLSKLWVAVLARALARHPRDRYPTAAALWADLSPALEGDIEQSRAKPFLAAVVGVALLAGGLALASQGLNNPTPVESPGPSTPSLVPTPTPSPTPRYSPFETHLRALWVSGDDDGLLKAVRDVRRIPAGEEKVVRRFRRLEKIRRRWRDEMLSAPKLARAALDELEKVRDDKDEDAELVLLARGVLAYRDILKRGIQTDSAFVEFEKSGVPALPELAPYLALVRPREAFERWPLEISSRERARLAAWLGEVDECRKSLEALPPDEAASLGWSLFAFVDPKELGLQGTDAAQPEDSYFRALTHAEQALALGDPVSAVLEFEALQARATAQVTFGLARSFIALGRIDVAAQVLRESADFSETPLLRSEWVGLSDLLLAGLQAKDDRSGADTLKRSLLWTGTPLATSSPWALRSLPEAKRPNRSPNTRLGRDGGTLTEQLALSRAGGDGAIGLGLARLYTLAESCRDGAGIDEANDLFPLLARFKPSSPASILPDAIRGRLDLVTCRVAPPPASLVACMERDESAASLVFQLRLAGLERDWFEAAERRLVAGKRIARPRALEATYDSIRADAQAIREKFPKSDTLRLLQARLIVEEARLAWLHNERHACFSGLGLRTKNALGSLLQPQLAQELVDAVRAPKGAPDRLEARLFNLTRARAQVTPEIAQAWSLRAAAGGPDARLFHQARRALDLDGPALALVATRRMERSIAGEISLESPRVDSKTLAVYSVRTAQICPSDQLPAAWAALVEAVDASPTLFRWARSVANRRAGDLAGVYEETQRTQPDSKLRWSLEAMLWLVRRNAKGATTSALRAAGHLPPGGFRSMATLSALVEAKARSPLSAGLEQEVAREVHVRDPQCLDTRSLIGQVGFQFTKKDLDRILATGAVSFRSTVEKFEKGLWALLAQRDGSHPRLSEFPRSRALARYNLFVDRGKEQLGIQNRPWPAWSASAEWSQRGPNLLLLARQRLPEGDREALIQGALRHLFASRPRTLSGCSPPSRPRVLPLAASRIEKQTAGLVKDKHAWRLAVRIHDPVAAWQALADGGCLTASEATFAPFNDPLARDLGVGLGRPSLRLRPEPTREFVRWAVLERPLAKTVSDTLAQLLVRPQGERPPPDLLEAARWLAWLAEGTLNSTERAALWGLALWTSCRVQSTAKGLDELMLLCARQYPAAPAPKRGLSREGHFRLCFAALLSGVLRKRPQAPADRLAAEALTRLERIPSTLASEPLLEDVLKAYPEFRAAYEAKLGPR
ncbi:MAG: serine/threonine protein kinase [Planctomycetes bacterium]|nr:serine/threonine protein kinase [Planctomycetota bacterium]